MIRDLRLKFSAGLPLQFRVWARPSFIDKIDYALAAGPKVLDFYSKYFQVPFPLKKQGEYWILLKAPCLHTGYHLDFLALPDFSAGAMENWGLVTYREIVLLYEDKASTSSERVRVATVIAHELGHQVCKQIPNIPGELQHLRLVVRRFGHNGMVG